MKILISEEQLKNVIESLGDYNEIYYSGKGTDSYYPLLKLSDYTESFEKPFWENEMNIENYNDIAFVTNSRNKHYHILLYNENNVYLDFQVTEENFGYMVFSISVTKDASGKGLGQKIYRRFVEMFNVPLYSDRIQTYSSRYKIWENLYIKTPDKVGCYMNGKHYKIEIDGYEMMCNGRKVYSSDIKDKDILLVLYP